LNSAIILLAAGSSSRLGKPKQLLRFHGKSLIRHIISIARQSEADEIIVVLGANHELILQEISDLNIRVVINHHWQEGIASSIRAGLEFLQQLSPSAESAIFAVCDQPFVSTELLNGIMATQRETKKLIVSSAYENTMGTPVLFHKDLFQELLALKGDSGAKKIILQHKSEVATIPFASGNIDIDTNDEYEALMN
jgi:molybdenum cofactor cytidylyltransferase